MSKVSVLLPAYNEEDRIMETLGAVKSIKCVNEIIVIDDGSEDETYKIAKEMGAATYKTQSNAGKGEALNLGLEKATGDIIVFLDADLGISAKEAEKLILPVLDGKADVTVAKFPRAKKKGGFGFVKRLARGGVKFFAGKTIDSVLSGQRVFKKEVLDKLGPMESGYGVEVGMTIDILNMGYNIQEVEVKMTHAETGRNLKGFTHRGKQFWHILKVLVCRFFQKGKK